MKYFVSSAVPPLTNKPVLSPVCWVPGSVLSAAVISELALAVVAMSIELKAVALFASPASKVPALITTAFNSVMASLSCMLRFMGEDAISIFSS